MSEQGIPEIVKRNAQHYVGLRAVTPFRGMFAEVSKLQKELRRWVNTHGMADEGPFLLRYHVIDMKGDMDIEVGFCVPSPLAGDGRVRPGVLPPGSYAILTYRGSDVQAIRMLLRWGETHSVMWDSRTTPAGDQFGCRYESYLTDYRLEPRKKQWDVQLAIRVVDDARGAGRRTSTA